MRAFIIGLLLLVLASCQVADSNPTASTLAEATAISITTPTTQPASAPNATPPSTPTALSAPAPVGEPAWQPLVTGLAQPVFITHSGDASGRLFIIEKPGRIRIFKNGALLNEPFLDIQEAVGSQGSEQGLLGLAFHPQFSVNGRFYVNYTNLNGDTVISRFTVSPQDANHADPASEAQVLSILQPYPNHNGGMMAFGPDGYLYIGMGDGGSSGDPQGNGQSLNTLLGKILRIDVDAGDPYSTPPDNNFSEAALPEIWAYGLRNPWRFSFDRQTGDLYIGDVGQNQWEEINYLPANSPAGKNFGWNSYEASYPYSGTTAPGFDHTLPVAEYDHSQGCSVTGGYVYRGSRLPDLQGVYLYGDYCSGLIWTLARDSSGAWMNAPRFEFADRIASFGEDQDGELYLVDLTGSVFTLQPNAPTASFDLQEQASVMLPEHAAELDSLGAIPQYTIDLTVDYAGHAFQGHSELLYTNLEDIALDSLYFRLLPNANGAYGDGSLAVSQVFVEGQPTPAALSLEDTILEVALAQPILPGDSINLGFDFSGVVPLDFTDPENPVGYGIYNLSEGVLSLASWYPILAVYDEDGWNLDRVSPIGDPVYSDIAYYSVNITAPQDMVVVTTGSEIDKKVENGQASHHIASGPVREFYLVMNPDFQTLSRVVNGTQVNSYFLPHHAEAGRQSLEVAADSLQSYNNRFGPYPYRELDGVDAPMENAGGVEYPGIFLVASFLYDDPERPNFTIATAHEVGHQWWYNLVGNDVFEDPWLDEGLTTYSSSLYYEDHQGPDWVAGLTQYWQDRYQALLDEGKDDQVARPVEYFERVGDWEIYGGVVYNKGGLFFNALRQEIGDEAFFQALQSYYQDFKYRIARPDDLLTAFERAAGRELDDFYNEWLYSP